MTDNTNMYDGENDQGFYEFYPNSDSMIFAAQATKGIRELKLGDGEATGGLIALIASIGKVGTPVATRAQTIAIKALSGILCSSAHVRDSTLRSIAGDAMLVAAHAYTPLRRAQLDNSSISPAGRRWGSGDWEALANNQLDELDAALAKITDNKE